MKADFPSDAAYEHAAWFLMCEARALKAIVTVESGPEGAFLATGEPVILYERHYFDRLTSGRFRGRLAPGISKRAHAQLSQPTAGGYGPYSIQHAKLAAAVALDREAALKSCSWGAFQIMGSNHLAAGFPDVQRFVNAMIRDVDGQLRGLVMFVRNNTRLLDAVRARDWALVAYEYNGPRFKQNQWDTKMRDAYARLA